MRGVVAVALVLALPACGMPALTGPLPAPSVDDARHLLDEVIEAGIERDWRRLCENASGTCEGELGGPQVKVRAPRDVPVVADVAVIEPTVRGEAWSSGGVLFVLCGVDGLGDPYESEVLVFDDGARLIATAAVYWVGTRVAFAPPGETVTVGEPTPGAPRCR
jgi:hypothetical protein